MAPLNERIPLQTQATKDHRQGAQQCTKQKPGEDTKANHGPVCIITIQ
jgi:hypothetical protein